MSYAQRRDLSGNRTVSIVMTVAVVGCVAIWGFDVTRAREVERDTAEQSRMLIALEVAERRRELEQHHQR